ncbi:hypothetical protein EB231_15580 [Mesorhizobium sp. NZP2298]|nr:hypothetical protein EB231_15580 [Mesorhizobium sp. NZP2298]
MFLRNSGRKTVTHFSWNCSRRRLLPPARAWWAGLLRAASSPARSSACCKRCATPMCGRCCQSLGQDAGAPPQG